MEKMYQGKAQSVKKVVDPAESIFCWVTLAAFTILLTIQFI